MVDVHMRQQQHIGQVAGSDSATNSQQLSGAARLMSACHSAQVPTIGVDVPTSHAS